MNSTTRMPQRRDVATLTAGLAGLLLGVALTFGIVVGTHWHERVRTVQVQTQSASESQSAARRPFPDSQSVDAANMIQHDPVGQSSESIAADQQRVDQENMILHDPVGQSPASAEAQALRVDQANMIRHDPPLSLTESSEPTGAGNRVGPGERDVLAPGSLGSDVTPSAAQPLPAIGPGERDFLAPGSLGGPPQSP